MLLHVPRVGRPLGLHVLGVACAWERTFSAHKPPLRKAAMNGNGWAILRLIFEWEHPH